MENKSHNFNENFWDDLASTKNNKTNLQTQDINVLNQFEKNDSLLNDDAKLLFSYDSNTKHQTIDINKNDDTPLSKLSDDNDKFKTNKIESKQVSKPIFSTLLDLNEVESDPTPFGYFPKEEKFQSRLKEPIPSQPIVESLNINKEPTLEKIQESIVQDNSYNQVNNFKDIDDEQTIGLESLTKNEFSFQQQPMVELKPKVEKKLPEINMNEIIKNINEINDNNFNQKLNYSTNKNINVSHEVHENSNFSTLRLMQNYTPPTIVNSMTKEQISIQQQKNTNKNNETSSNNKKTKSKLIINWKYLIFSLAWLVIVCLLIAILFKK